MLSNTLPNTNFNFSLTLSSADAFNLNQSKVLSFGKDLNSGWRWTFSGGFLCVFLFRVVKIKVCCNEVKIRFDHSLDRIFTLSQTTNFSLFKLKEFVGNNFELNEIGRKILQMDRKHFGKRRNH